MTDVKSSYRAGLIIVHGLGHATAALTAARAQNSPVTIASAVGAVRSGGAGWWRELAAQAHAAVPDATAKWVLDCADEAGMALAALREGVAAVALETDPSVWSRVSQIAAQCDAELVRLDRSGALDLANSNNPQQACDWYLSDTPDGVANPDALG